MPDFVSGPVAQLGARFNRTEEAEGSNPSRSIKSREASDGQPAGADRVDFNKNFEPTAHAAPFPGDWEREGQTQQRTQPPSGGLGAQRADTTKY